jgi:hypothetical protein
MGATTSASAQIPSLRKLSSRGMEQEPDAYDVPTMSIFGMSISLLDALDI